MDDLFSAPAHTGASRIRVGIGGWTFAPWRGGVFYPEKLVQRRELEYASRQLTAIEINGTFYGPQKPATFARWRSETPDGFLFALKAPKQIVESRRLAETGARIDGFIQGGIAELGDRLGPLLGMFGALLGAFVFGPILGGGNLLETEFDPMTPVVAGLGAALLCGALSLLASRRRRP